MCINFWILKRKRLGKAESMFWVKWAKHASMMRVELFECMPHASVQFRTPSFVTSKIISSFIDLSETLFLSRPLPLPSLFLSRWSLHWTCRWFPKVVEVLPSRLKFELLSFGGGGGGRVNPLLINERDGGCGEWALDDGVVSFIALLLLDVVLWLLLLLCCLLLLLCDCDCNHNYNLWRLT